jgi:hypothetical protein
MTAKDALGLLVRTFGLLLLYGIYHGIYAVIEAAGLAPDAHIPASKLALFAFVYVVIALLIVRGADHIVRFAYGSQSS